MARKGAFELSMGFIITVVFAVVLLSLAIVWIQDLMGGLDDLSGSMLGNAQGKIRELFSSGDDDFYIWPVTYELELKTDTRIGVLATTRNNADDGEDHKFVMNVYSVEVPTGVKREDVNKWITFPTTEKMVKQGGDDSREIRITIPKDAKKGDYYFEIASCWDGEGSLPKSSSCNSESNALFGDAAKDFILVVQ